MFALAGVQEASTPHDCAISFGILLFILLEDGTLVAQEGDWDSNSFSLGTGQRTQSLKGKKKKIYIVGLRADIASSTAICRTVVAKNRMKMINNHISINLYYIHIKSG
jgi:hypothetical protein